MGVRLRVLLWALLGVPALAQPLNPLERRTLQQVEGLLQAGDAAEAVRLARPLWQQRTASATAYRYACRAEESWPSDQAQPLTCWRSALAAHPDDAELAQAGASQMLRQGLALEAERALAPLLPCSAGQAQCDRVLYLTGYAYHLQQRYPAVVALYRDRPVPPAARPLLAHALGALADWRGLERFTGIWLAQAPAAAQGWQWRASALANLDRPRAAAAAQEVVALLGDEQDASRRQALYARIGAYSLASQCLSGFAGGGAPEQPLACLQQGWLSGRLQATLAAVDGYQPSDEQWDRWQLLLGRLHQELGQASLARAAWLRVGARPLPPASTGAAAKQARQQRDRARAEALQLLGQSYWLERRWADASRCYRRLQALPGQGAGADAYLTLLARLEGDKKMPTDVGIERDDDETGHNP